MIGRLTEEAAPSSTRIGAAAAREHRDSSIDPRRAGLERVVVALVASAIAGPLLVSALRGLGAPIAVAIGLSLCVGLAIAVVFAPRLPTSLEGSLRRAPLLATLWLLLGAGSAVATVRLSTFMMDESRHGASMLPFDEFFVHHSCMSSYYQGALFQRQGVPNVYQRTQYEGGEGEPHFIGELVIDPFQYPPPFLLFPRLGLLASENFRAWRAVWFGLEGAIVAAGLLVTAFWLGGKEGLRAGLLIPVVWLSMPTLTTLQHGNFHLVTIVVAVLAMIAFDRGRSVLGGALLATVVVSKIFPGVLLLYLLFRRRWGAVIWTTSFSALLVLIALAVLGPKPFQAFASYQLPRLTSGAAFETIFVHPDAVVCSHAIFAIIQKLGLIGVPGMTLDLASQVAGLYAIALVGVSYLASRVRGGRLTMALVWLGLIQLASLRSPFAPDVYAQFAPLWIVTLLLARGGWKAWQVGMLAVAALLLNNIVPTQPAIPIPALAALTLAHQLVFIALCVWVVWPRGGRAVGVSPAAA